MKKIFKLGFSLSEILIALAIISIISTLGISVARHNVDKAYNMYVYTSYKGITDAINYANVLLETEDAGLNYANPFQQANGTPTTYFNAILQALSADLDSVEYTENSAVEFTTPNKVQYKITKFQQIEPGQGNNFDANHIADYIIGVTIPKRKTRERATSTYCLLYRTNSTHELLIPFNTISDASDNVVCSTSLELTDLVTRTDLLPLYIDNGIVGRRIPKVDDPAGDYTKRSYTNFSNGYCDTYAEDIQIGDTTIVDCTNATTTPGTVLIADPRNL